MYEFHGWATIRWTTNGDTYSWEYEQAANNEAAKKIKARIEGLPGPPFVFDIRPQPPGEYHVWAAGVFNHRPSSEDNPVVDLMRFIGNVAPGSYGLLYTYDSDAVDAVTEGINEFRVYVLARGQVQERCDPFLSPIIPVVEDKV